MIIGIVGGSGLYKLDETGTLKGEKVAVDTPYGKPSGDYFKLTTAKHTLYFLPRHGEGHVLLPSEINYRANVYGFKKLGVETLISISAVGSLKKEIAPGHFVLPDQYIDLTRNRTSTFFGGGVVAHAHFADPACSSIRGLIAEVASSLKVKVHHGGTYVCMEGPQFSTRSESNWYRCWGLEKGKVDVIGMTALPEAKLAREASLCYQTVAMATDYDCWNEEHGDVTLEAILKVLHDNVAVSRNLVTQIANRDIPRCTVGCRDQMKNAVVTAQELWPAKRREELKVILGH